MKKLVLLTVFVISILFSGCFKKPIHKVKLGYLTSNFMTPYYLNGKVKEYTQVTYLAKMENGMVVKGDQILNSKAMQNITTRQATFNFNKQGKMEKATFYDDQGNPNSTAHYIYEDDKLSGVLIKSGETPIRHDKMFYDDGRITKIEIYNNVGLLIRKHVYKYDEDGRIIKELRLNSEGEQIYSNEFDRFENGNWQYSTGINRFGNVVRKNENVYDENGVLVATNIKVLNGQDVDIKGKKVFDYDENGNWTKIVRYRDDIPFNITERSFVYY